MVQRDDVMARMELTAKAASARRNVCDPRNLWSCAFGSYSDVGEKSQPELQLGGATRSSKSEAWCPGKDSNLHGR
ncbi:hypothetical protein BRAO375_2550001 [Bradyrhizobium sp. ORS 375]|nr:hypothetical protein BRAO375_2550001 [Bradyrhizobium sp. ORS 375]